MVAVGSVVVSGFFLSRIMTTDSGLQLSPPIQKVDQNPAPTAKSDRGLQSAISGRDMEIQSSPANEKAEAVSSSLQNPADKQKNENISGKTKLPPVTQSDGKTQDDDALFSKASKEEHVCAFINDKIKAGEDIKKFIRTSLQMGYNPCALINCAIKGGGNLEQIIAGAVEAGATHAVISKCCMNAGVDANELTRTFAKVGSPTLCYSGELFGYSPLPDDEPVPVTFEPPPKYVLSAFSF